MRLNQLQRAGVVASILWVVLVGGGTWIAEGKRWSDLSGLSYRACVSSADAMPTSALQEQANGRCKSQMERDLRATRHDGEWAEESLFNAVGGVLIGWLTAYAVLGTIRWVRAGRR